MNILCISCSNTKNMGEQSISTLTTKYIKDLLIENGHKEDEIKTVSLQNYNVNPCIFCGACSKTESCPYDEAFNKIYQLIKTSEYIFLVVPYYSIVPAKLTIILEKMNEIFYASWINGHHFQPKSTQIKIGLIGHGGMIENEQVLKHYHTHLITPIANTLKGLGFHIIKESEAYPFGVSFGLLSEKDMYQEDHQVFPTIKHDEKHIKDRIRNLVLQVNP